MLRHFALVVLVAMVGTPMAEPAVPSEAFGSVGHGVASVSAYSATGSAHAYDTPSRLSTQHVVVASTRGSLAVMALS